MAFVSTNAYTTQGEVGMEFSGFDWDRGNLEKCQKHGISAKLIESVFDRPVAILPDETHSRKEQRLRARKRCSVRECASSGRMATGRSNTLSISLAEIP